MFKLFRLFLSAMAGSMVVTWVTWNSTAVSAVAFGPAVNWLWNRAIGTETMYVDEGSQQRVYYVHRVALLALLPGGTVCTLLFSSSYFRS